MPRKFFKRILPEPGNVRDQWYLKRHRSILHDPRLWAIQRKSLARGLAVGLFAGSIPFPGHVLYAALGAILARGNIPIAIAGCFYTNPFTVGPYFYFIYRVGCALLGTEPESIQIEWSLEWIAASVDQIWTPLLLGGLSVGLVLAALGYALINLVWWLAVVTRLYGRNRRKARNSTRD